ncbi:hypothetical protein J2X55_002215 [Microbacterium sp. 1154]|uniref:hypothetical protein n=1 Tax=Microbacterium sp. 1154 TaxID=2817733 RepID=UPI00285D2469|nr:hypothetical protein [Microbacterium sp. 1154]MDR6691303.1 hypothetical protein [Microbacterium sp. 1154]
MRWTIPFLAATVASVLVLSACASQPAPEPTTTEAAPPTFTPTVKPTPAESSTGQEVPASDAVLILDLDGASIAAGSTLEYSITAVDAWSVALGVAPSRSAVQGPYGETGTFTALGWSGFTLTVPDDGSTRGASVRVSTPTVAGHPVVTSGGVGVGSTRAEAVAVGATEGFDSSELRMDTRDAPGTQSSQRPGEVGREYVKLVLEGDSVVQIILPANDFGDI